MSPKPPRDGPPLPIDGALGEIRARFAAGNRLVIQAEPGAGKSTRIPPALLDEPWLQGRSILVLEPRRIAARNLAAFIADELGEPLGGLVGLQVRGERRCGPRTRLEIVTEGILTRRIQSDPELAGVGAILFDEFHERHLQTDLSLALALDVQDGLREDLRIGLMSATIDAGRLGAWLDAPAVTCEGTRHPVEIAYRPAGEDRRERERALVDAVEEALAASAGDVLAFLPGRAEIDRARGALAALPVDLRPLYGALPLADQRAALAPREQSGARQRVVLATNIAESSLTVPGVSAVVDSGLERVPRYDPRSGLTRLVTRRISADSAQQRAGRAGRLGPGHCFRIWSPAERLIPQRQPEILSSDLTGLALELAAWGLEVGDAYWLDAPPEGACAQARDLLQALRAIDDRGAITAYGRRLLRWGTEPRLAAILEGAGDDQVLAAHAVTILEARDPLPEGGDDLRERIRAWGAGRLPRAIRSTLDRDLERWLGRAGRAAPGRPPAPAQIDQRLGLVLARGYPDRLARRRIGAGDRYQLANGRGVELARDSAFSGQDWLVICDARLDSGDSRVRLAAPIDAEDVDAAFRDRVREGTSVRWEPRTGEVLAERQRTLGAIVLERRPWTGAPPEAVVEALLVGIRRAGLACLPWSRAARSLRDRVRCLHAVAPDSAPDWSEQALLGTLEHWLAPQLHGHSRLEGLRSLDLASILQLQLQATLGHRAARDLDRLVPRAWTVPSGREAPIDYSSPDKPVLAVKLQELFGQTETPRIAGGRLPLTLHLLSPAGRALQITQDLVHFWANGYGEVRKEMRGRYPKHPWPEDPLTATATRRTKRRGG